MARLIYLVGASGAGKDTLLHYIREVRQPHDLLVAHRYITRAANSGGENHIALTEWEFQQRLEAGLFALHWRSHGYCYGIGIELDRWLERGFHVLVNGSRAHLQQVRERYPDYLPVMLEVSEPVLRARIARRGRESTQQIEARLSRTRRLESVSCPGLVAINNDGAIEQTAHQLCAFVDGSH